TITLYPEVTTIRVACLLDGGATGTAWFDDIIVEAVPQKPRQACKLRVALTELPSEFQAAPKSWPDEVLAARIEGNQIVKNGRPVFLVGAWSLEEDTWLCRVLGLDYTTLHMGDYSFFTRTTDTGEFEIGWGDAPWIEGMIREALAAGLMVRADMHGASEDASHLQPVREGCPEIFVPHGHYANFCPHHPLGLDIYRAKFASWVARTRKYPIWAYKVFNELSFIDYCEHNLSAFREAMRHKYGTIEAANGAWGTAFNSFDEIKPPELKSYSTMQSEGVPINLWVDWLKFCEADNIRHLVAPCVQIHRQLDPGQAQGYRGVQSHCNLLFDYGAATIDPADKGQYEDYYSHECGGSFYAQVEGRTDIGELEDMLRFLLSYDIARSVCPDKPIINDENYFTGTSRLSSPEAARSRAVADLSGKWRFRTDPRDTGLGEAWQSPATDDSSWEEIEAGRSWEAQGKEDYDGVAWYRRHVRLSVPRAGRRLHLVGTGIDDRAQLFVNGRLVGQASNLAEVFALDISAAVSDGDNVIALRVEDAGGLGGLRGWMVISPVGMQPASLSPGQMRARLWSEVIHGASATVIGYTSDELWGLFNPDLCSREALKCVPFIKNNINALGEIVLPKPRIRGQAAIVWPQETLRARLPRSYEEFLSG
ncbi:MAG: beta-galactosidase, partial [Armatimonadetes bacterium]|nr:beta-galactosidase [Armatimonadota bacterium]